MLSRLYGPVRRLDSWWVSQNPLSASVHHARVIVVAAVLIGISAVGPSTRLHAQQPPAELAIDELRELAEQGDAEAQAYLGFRYSIGSDVPRNVAEAVRWYRLAAEQGNEYAQINLGYMYATAEGVPQDYAVALHWYRLAADQGNAGAQYNLGIAYDTG